MSEETITFPTGAVRSADKAGVRYDLISPIGLAAWAAACAEGAEKYGDYNWEKGMSVNEMLNHAIAHIYAYLAGDRREDHLGHAIWNVGGAIHSAACWPELSGLRGPGCAFPSSTAEPERLQRVTAAIDRKGA